VGDNRRQYDEESKSASSQACAWNAAAAIEFYKNAFSAEETTRMPGPGGKLMHAERKIGNPPVAVTLTVRRRTL
jgi:PhnB protein